MAEAVVSYRFVAVGVDAVKRSFQSIDEAAKASLAKTQKAFYNQQQWQERAARRSSEITSKAFEGSFDKIKAEQDKSTEQWRRYFGRIKDMAKGAKTSVNQSLGGATNAPRAGAGVGAARSLGGVALGAKTVVGAAAALGGGALLMRSLTSAIDSEKSAARISALTATGGNAAIDKSMIQQAVFRKSQAVKGTTQADAYATLEGLMDRFGDFDAAMKLLTPTLEAAAITGQDTGTLVELLSGMKSSGGVAVKDLPNALATALQQGKSGSVPLGRFAGGYTKLLASASLGGYTARQGGIEELGSIFQMLGPSLGSADEAITAISRTITKLAEAAPALGIPLTDSAGGALDLGTILTTAAAKTYAASGGNVQQSQVELNKLFDIEGAKVVGRVLNEMVKATGTATPSIAQLEEQAKGTAGWLMRLKNETANAAALTAEAAKVTQTTGATLSTAFEKITKDIGEQMRPEVGKMAESLAKLQPLFGGLVVILGGIMKTLGYAVQAGTNIGTGLVDGANQGVRAAEYVKRRASGAANAFSEMWERGETGIEYVNRKAKEAREFEAGPKASLVQEEEVNASFSEQQITRIGTIIGSKVGEAVKQNGSFTGGPWAVEP